MSRERAYRGKYPARVRCVGSVTTGAARGYRLTLNDGRMFDVASRNPHMADLALVGEDFDKLKAGGWYTLTPYIPETTPAT